MLALGVTEFLLVAKTLLVLEVSVVRFYTCAPVFFTPFYLLVSSTDDCLRVM